MHLLPIQVCWQASSFERVAPAALPARRGHAPIVLLPVPRFHAGGPSPLLAESLPMNTGDTVRDARGSTYEVGRSLGRGSWARCFSARQADTGRAVVIKVPLSQGELGGDARLAEACRTIMAEQGKLAETEGVSCLPELVGRMKEGGGIVFANAGLPLAEVGTRGKSTGDILLLVSKALDGLKSLSAHTTFHGNLTTANILVDDRGNVTLTDPVTPTFRRHQAALYSAAGTSADQLAPELRGPESPLPLSVQADTWALSLQLIKAITLGQERFGKLPINGLDKPHRVALKDQLLNRLRKEPSNPGFHERLAERLVSLLNRSLSRETSPSPPYRFRDPIELQQRFDDVRVLVHPTIENTGRLNWSLRAGADAFQTDEEVKFTLNVGCSHGVEGRDEIATGIALFDKESDRRIRDIVCAYSVDKHPSGRFRFLFKLSDLRPGTFRVRVAFTIRDSGDEPTTAEGEFQVRPAPGYIPPRSTPSRSPIPLDRQEDDTVAQSTEPGVDTERPTMTDPRSAPRRPVHRPVDDETPTVAAEPAGPTPIAPHRPTNLAPPSQSRPSSPGLRRTSHARPFEPGAPRVTTPIRASQPGIPQTDAAGRRPSHPGHPASPGPAVGRRATSPGRPSQPGRPSYPGRPSSPGPSGQRTAPPQPVSPATAERPLRQPDRGTSGGPTGRGSQPSTARGSQPGLRSPDTDRSRPSHPGPSTAREPARPSNPGPTDLPDVDPSFPVMGSWVDLDVAEPTTRLEPADPHPSSRRLPTPRRLPPEFADDEALGPVGAAVRRLIELVKADAYYMFLAVAFVLIIILGVTLIAFGPSSEP